MAKTNFQYEKRQRELEKKRKTEEKARKKQEAKQHRPEGSAEDGGEGADESPALDDGDAGEAARQEHDPA